MPKESDRKHSTVATSLPFRWRPVRQVLGPPELLPAGGPALGGWAHPLEELATRSRDVGQSIRRRVERMARESVTCAMAILWVTCIGCASAIGWGRPRRVLTSAVVFTVPWFFLAMPAEWVTVQTWSEFVAAGHWAASAKLTAGLLGGGLLTFHFVMALVRVPVAREQLPMLCLEDRLSQAEDMFQAPVDSEHELSQWVTRVRKWSGAVETELHELLSPDVAYAFRRVVPGQTIRHTHRFNAVHDGWLNMLSWRRDLLADLVDPRARRAPTRAPSEFRSKVA
ncbi:MAG: hypothetical protein ACYTG2_13385 [Planctomycetota bacterium]